MQEKITDGDIEILCAANPMASEQLRRIVAERQRAELLADVAALTSQLAELKHTWDTCNALDAGDYTDIESAKALVNGVMNENIPNENIPAEG